MLKVQAALDKALDEGNLGPWWTAFAQGHGQPPQALDMRVGNLDGENIRFTCIFADGSPIAAGAVPVPADSADGSSEGRSGG